jgi:hypothetical protein
MTVAEVFNWLYEFGCFEINIRFSNSGSAYFEADYHDSVSTTDTIKVRVSDHPHPGTYEGICLFRGDKLPELPPDTFEGLPW